jgi:hypothetical protein
MMAVVTPIMSTLCMMPQPVAAWTTSAPAYMQKAILVTMQMKSMRLEKHRRASDR